MTFTSINFLMLMGGPVISPRKKHLLNHTQDIAVKKNRGGIWGNFRSPWNVFRVDFLWKIPRVFG